MDKPKKIWVFDQTDPIVYGPFTVIGENADGRSLRCKVSDIDPAPALNILKTHAASTKKDVVLACYRYYEKRIAYEQAKLNRQKQLLNRFYSEEYYE